jgi:hypothetical protein
MDFERNEYPALNFEWIENGNLRLIKIAFSDSEILSYILEPEGNYYVHDNRGIICKETYMGQIPKEIKEGETIIGEKIRLHINTEEELKKIIKSSNIINFYEDLKMC